MSDAVAQEHFASRVTLTVTDFVARVALARPEALNGLDWAMIEGLLAVQRRLTSTPESQAAWWVE